MEASFSDMEPFAIAFLTMGAAVMGWALRTLYAKSEKNESDLNAHKIEAASTFVKRAEMSEALTTARADFTVAVNAVRMDGRADNDRLEKRFDKMENWMGSKFDDFGSKLADLMSRKTKE